MATTQSRRTGARTLAASSKAITTSTSAPGSQSTSERSRHDVVTVDAPLTTRGTRRSRRGGGGGGGQGPGRKETDNGTTASTHHFADRGAAWISDEADGDVEEVETSRRERVEAVVVPAWTKKWKPTDLGEQEKHPQVLDTAHKSLPPSLIEVSAAATFSTMTTTTTMTTDTVMASDTPMEVLSDTEISHEKSIQNQRDPFDDDRNLGKSLFFEDLSLSPPPPPLIFDREEEVLDGSNEESRWMMDFDSQHQSAQDAPRRIIPDLEHTHLEDDHHGEDHDLPTVTDTWRQKEDQERGDDDDDVEEDDDPFGFFKVERQLHKTKNLRPKLLAINEVHHRPIATAVFSKNSNNSTSSSSKDTDHGSVSVSDQGFRERLDQSVLQRAVNRRRGEGKGKGKAIDRESSSSSSHLGHEADRSQSNTTTDPMDEDLQKAIRLSRGLDIEIGEGSSSFEKPSTTLSRYDPDVTNDMTMGFSADPILRDIDEEEEPLTRNNRRISRQYGRVASVDIHADADNGIATKAQNTSQTTTTDNATRTHDHQMSGQTVVESDHDDPDEAFRPLSPSPPARKVPDQKRLSFGSDDFPPILIETTPKKKPEAGMPLSMDISPPPSPSIRTNKSRGRMSKKSSHKPLLTEQLEALLPQRRFKREPLGSKNKRVGRTKGRKDVVMIESSDEESDDEEDNPRRVHGNKGKKKGVAEARHQNRPTTKQRSSRPTLSSSVRDTAPSGKKRRAPADVESYTPVPKRNHVQKSMDADLSSKSKEKHQADMSGWSASQLAAQKERIKYFQQVDDFELEVETV
ncbi:hypothetical protein BGX34_004656 [Mortierella sp. NVP85]|nr:hypothetical protein BGX34_004656 [Mortierella sp. NVP85]